MSGATASSENSNFVFQDINKRIWVGTQSGLHCLDSNLRPLFPAKRSIGVLRAATNWNRNEILVSGSQGILRVGIRKDTIYTESLHPFFNNISVNLVFKDRKGKLWAGTSQGLYRMDSATQKIE